MEIFKKEIKLNNLAEVYAGFKLDIIGVDEVFNYIENDKVEDFGTSDYSRLIKNKENSIKFNEFYRQINEFTPIFRIS